MNIKLSSPAAVAAALGGSAPPGGVLPPRTA